ncbi:EAL domain-containing protein [Psychromonas sp. MME1]|uniref:EAL domain-containing protein n=1 Tax=Psychromonas sp. MME1 TaxID=3231032 RepID=UPI0034E1B43D
MIKNKTTGLILEPFFQPIINVENGLIAYNEVLARIKNNKNNYISAGSIFSSENLPIDKRICFDKQVRNKALEKFKTYDGNARLSINISPSWFSLHAPHLQLKSYEVPTLSMLKECGIDPSRIIIELTEYDGDKDLINHFVRSYREMGIQVAIDDFGTGFSQIERLLEIEPDIIKLDMALFQRSLVSNYTQDLIEVFANFAKKRGIVLIFEGIETPQQYDVAVSSEHSLYRGTCFHLHELNFITMDIL